MRVIIAGSREFNDYDLLKRECFRIFKQLKSEGYNTSREYIEIVCGEAPGADKLGKQFGVEYNIPVKSFPAQWDDLDTQSCFIKYNKYGKPYNALAGTNRNKNMAIYAKEDPELGVLIDFWNGVSKGSKNMINLAKKYKLRVFVVNF
jgi:hypothetical protein